MCCYIIYAALNGEKFVTKWNNNKSNANNSVFIGVLAYICVCVEVRK